MEVCSLPLTVPGGRARGHDSLRGSSGGDYCCCVPPGWQGVQGSFPPGKPKTGRLIAVLAPWQPQSSPGHTGCALQSISCSGRQEHLCQGHGAGQLGGRSCAWQRGDVTAVLRHLHPACVARRAAGTAGSPGSEKAGSWHGQSRHSLEQAHAGRGTQVERGARLLLLGHVSKSLVQAGHQACPCSWRVEAVAGNAGTCREETALLWWVDNAQWDDARWAALLRRWVLQVSVDMEPSRVLPHLPARAASPAS